MAINPLSSNLVNLLSPEAVSSLRDSLGAREDAGSFADIFSEAINNVQETDAAGKASTLELLSGQTDDLVGIMVGGEKAEIALSLALSMRNKVLDAYTEIMRMQV